MTAKRGFGFTQTMLSLSRVWLLLLLLIRAVPLCGLLVSGPVFSQTLGVQLQHWQPAELEGRSDGQVPRQLFQLDWMIQPRTRMLYRYEPIRLREGEPAHNGHLHQFRTEMTRQWDFIEISAALGIQGSSNRFAYLRFSEEMLVGEGVVFRRFNENWMPDIGLAGDHRFGPFLVYPRLRWQGELMDWDWHLDLPVEASLREDRWELELARVGSRWSVLDRDRRVETHVYLYEWQVSADYHLRQAYQRGPEVTLGVGSSFATRLRYRDRTQGRKTRQLSSAVFVRLKVSGSPGS